MSETNLDQAREIDAGPGVDDRETRDHEDAPAGVAHLPHLACDPRDEDLLRFLGGDLASHEAENLRLPRAFQRSHAHALVTDHDLHPRLRILEDDAARTAGLAVDGDRGVHLDAV